MGDVLLAPDFGMGQPMQGRLAELWTTQCAYV